MRIGIPKEVHPGERRVAATPAAVLRLVKMGFEIIVEAGAGVGSDMSDAAFAEAGATVSADVREVWASSDVVLKVRAPEAHPTAGVHEAELLREGGMLIGFIWPAQNRELVEMLAARRATVLAMDCVPRVTRAQKMDALSAMANIAGYRAIIEAAHHFPRFFAGQITAAGKIEPAKVMVIGAGVAGLAAIGAARALGAIVRAFDTRPAVKEQVQSMGAEFLDLHFEEEGAGAGGYAKEMSPAFIAAEMELFAQQAMEVDIIVTTALIPGKPAPKLITAGMVESMADGSVIVDLAAEQGGNCALTKPGQVVVHKGVTIIGFADLPSRMASQSSQLYATCLVNLVEELGGTKLDVNEDDEVIRGALVLREGRLMWPPPKPPPPAQTAEGEPSSPSAEPASAEMAVAGKGTKRVRSLMWLGLAGALLLGVGAFAPAGFLAHLTVFVLACFVGWQVVWNVTPALHTPLMSVTNAISGIIIVGGMLAIGGRAISAEGGAGKAAVVLGGIAVLVAMVNVVGGFLVTKRMLGMFRR